VFHRLFITTRNDDIFKMSLDIETALATHVGDKPLPLALVAPYTWLHIWQEATKISLDDLVPLGCLTSLIPLSEPIPDHWREVFEITLPAEISFFVDAPRALDKAVQRLLKAGWIRLFARELDDFFLYRVYILPDDIGRTTVARGSRSLRAELEQLLPKINTNPALWNGDKTPKFQSFDSWAQPEEGSLFYIFNTLPSPDPRPEDIEDRFNRTAVTELLDYDRLLSGLQTPLYPYQARSAAAMIQRESSTELQLDPRFEKRWGPDGSLFYYIPKDLAFYRNPPLYDSHRGGILAETMGLGKTVICLAVILATKGHLPKIPPQYQRQIVREKVPRLLDLCIATAGRHSIPAKAHFTRLQRESGEELLSCTKAVDSHEIDYFIPGKAPRSNRRTLTPPPKRMILCSGTIIVVPRNIVSNCSLDTERV
jgi:SNF2-related domain